MNFYDKYLIGSPEQVYQDIYSLGEDAFLPKNLPQIEEVLIETFQRVAYNLDIIYSELKKIDYLFETKIEYNFQRPLVQPLADTEQLLVKLENAVRPFGFVPLSLKMFYRIVGSCNFGWDYETNEDYIWQFADPIQIRSLDDVVLELTGTGSAAELQANYKEDGFVSIQLAADYFHKDNTSGGPAYSIKVSDKESVDAEFLNEEHETTFINYLRICFENCGFSRITNPASNNDYQSFFENVKPKLKAI